MPFVDVRDVAKAHVLALKATDAANKRIIINKRCTWFSEILTMLSTGLSPHQYKL
jgi:nucleoside-diphosphate-sugar epimerase